MSTFQKDYAVRSDYWSDDDFLAELREIAGSNLPDSEKLELLVRKLDVLSDEDVRRPLSDARGPRITVE